jgi:hypothetical protein
MRFPPTSLSWHWHAVVGRTATISCVLRLRNALEQASRRRLLGLVVIAFVAVLLVLVAFHSFDHALELSAAVTCLALAVSGAIVLVAADTASGRLVAAPWGRGPPKPEAAGAPTAGVAARRSIPLRR